MKEVKDVEIMKEIVLVSKTREILHGLHTLHFLHVGFF